MEDVRVSETLTMRLTGNQTTVPSTYSARVFYRAHCAHNTTLGEFILAGAWNSSMLAFLQRFYRLQWVISRPFLLLVLIFYVLWFICHVVDADAVSAEVVCWFSLFVAVVHTFPMVYDCLLAVWIDIPLRAAWPCFLVICTQSSELISDSSNEFLEIERTDRVEYMSTDLSSHFVFQSLEATGKVKIMLYNSTWIKDWPPLSISVTFVCWANFVFLYADPDWGLDMPSYGPFFTLLVLWIAVRPTQWSMLFYICAIALAHVVNTLLCCFPQRWYESFWLRSQERIIARAIEAKSNNMAVKQFSYSVFD